MKYAGWKELRNIVKKADIVLEVVDARIPEITRSRRLESLAEREGKEILLVINKADLVPKEVVEKWKKTFEKQGYPTVYISAKKRLGTRILRVKIKELVERKHIVATVVGYPKVGKSSIINVLKGKHSASTSPIPGSVSP